MGRRARAPTTPRRGRRPGASPRRRRVELRPRHVRRHARAERRRRRRGRCRAARGRDPRCDSAAAPWVVVHVEQPVGLGEHLDRVAAPARRVRRARRSRRGAATATPTGSAARRRAGGCGRSSSVSFRSMTCLVASSASGAATAVARRAISLERVLEVDRVRLLRELADQGEVRHDELRRRLGPRVAAQEPVQQAEVELEVGGQVDAADAWCGAGSRRAAPSSRRGSRRSRAAARRSSRRRRPGGSA